MHNNSNYVQIIITFAPENIRMFTGMKENSGQFRKGESGNPAGKPKGAQNKTTTDLRSWINNLIEKNLPKIEKDLKSLESKDRLVILERLMQYSLPKLQGVSMEMQIQCEYEALEKLLSKAPDEAIQAITDKVIRLNKLNTKQ